MWYIKSYSTSEDIASVEFRRNEHDCNSKQSYSDVSSKRGIQEIHSYSILLAYAYDIDALNQYKI